MAILWISLQNRAHCCYEIHSKAWTTYKVLLLLQGERVTAVMHSKRSVDRCPVDRQTCMGTLGLEGRWGDLQIGLPWGPAELGTFQKASTAGLCSITHCSRHESNCQALATLRGCGSFNLKGGSDPQAVNVTTKGGSDSVAVCGTKGSNSIKKLSRC